MYKLAKPLFILVETSLHAGSGSDLGIVDLPIQRERHTGFPKVESSSLKGCIRQAFEELINTKELKGQLVKDFPGIDQIANTKNANKNKITKYEQAISLVFGPENPDKGESHAGALGFTDARLLLFPVKSVKGVFAWVTCPRVLNRMVSDLELTKTNNMPEIPKPNSVPPKNNLTVNEKFIILEEYTFKVAEDDKTKKLAEWFSKNLLPVDKSFDYWREKMKTDIVVLTDDDFTDFVNLSTEVITRTKINNETGTVQPGALFTEEYLPPETILYSLALTTPLFVDQNTDKGIFDQSDEPEEAEIMRFWLSGVPEVLQLGANSTIGKGLIRIKIGVGGNGN